MREERAVAPTPAESRIEERETQSAREAIASGRAVPENARSIGILILTLLAATYTLYFGKEIILPIVMALVLKLLLQPAMRLLHERLRLPNALAALLLILAVFGAIAGVGFTISVPATSWIQKAPESLPLLKEKLAPLRGPIDYVQRALQQMDAIASTTASPNTPEQSGGAAPAPTAQQGGGGGGSSALSAASGVAMHVVSGTATTLSRFFTTMIVLFFMLASGDRLLRGFVEVLPSRSDKRQAVEIANEIETNIAGYLLTITIMNVIVGVATGLAMKFCGLGDPILWGSMAFLLNYIPILGPMTGVVIFFAAGILSLQWPWYALLPAGIYLLIHIAEGETITPMLLAKRFTLNPVLVIISLFFWHSLWGIPGALLAVPLLAMFKILADHVEPLKPVGHIIGS